MSQSDFKLSPELRLGPLCLRTKNMGSMLSFYEEDLGLKVVHRNGEFVALATHSGAEPILILHEDPKASNPPPNATGLYHYALLQPNRRSLAASYLTLGRKGVAFDGYADHQVSEALYLSDPEGNGIEIYHDRPRSEWKFDDAGVDMTTRPLDLDSLIKEVPREESEGLRAIDEGTKLGHVHFKVSDLQTSVTFYRDALGLDLMRYLGSAAFLSAGQYHHHVGMNTWESLGGPTIRKTWVGLEYFALTISETNLNELSDELGVRPILQSDNSSRLLLSDPDNIDLVFTASDQRPTLSIPGK